MLNSFFKHLKNWNGSLLKLHSIEQDQLYQHCDLLWRGKKPIDPFQTVENKRRFCAKMFRCKLNYRRDKEINPMEHTNYK